jgi:hypothetical protein
MFFSQISDFEELTTFNEGQLHIQLERAMKEEKLFKDFYSKKQIGFYINISHCILFIINVGIRANPNERQK